MGRVGRPAAARAVELDFALLQLQHDGDLLLGREPPLLLVPRGLRGEELMDVGAHDRRQHTRGAPP
jgi:hypothetical protein